MSDFLNYKDKPLVRKGNTVYYGDMSEKYVIKLEILSSHTEGELEVADKIKVMLIKNDSEKLDNVTKSTEKNGFAEAMQFATTWLTRALADK
ncbi:MAG: hypothetical protein IIW94_03960 [Clostridia bacterium]|nr:hypothetical protein [Clostridia bacterium]